MIKFGCETHRINDQGYQKRSHCKIQRNKMIRWCVECENDVHRISTHVRFPYKRRRIYSTCAYLDDPGTSDQGLLK